MNKQISERFHGGAFLSPVIQQICERLASTDFRDYFDKGLVNKLETTLNFINLVLDDAETKQYEDLGVKCWLDDVSNEVYELEQLLDVIATDAAQQKGKIQRFLSGSINRFESRIKVLLKRLEFLAKEKSRLELQEFTNYLYEERASGFATSFMAESIIYGREREKEEIIKFLLSDSYNRNQVSIISIVGLKGMGKTALAQLVCNDHRIQEQFELKAWLHVPKYFDPVDLTISILRSFHSSAAHSQHLEILQHQLQQLLKGKKYLLVLDSVWEIDKNKWEKLLLFKCGSS